MAVDGLHAGPIKLGEFIGEVTLLPADPPREASFALWRPAPGFAPRGRARLVVAGREGAWAEEVPVARAPLPAAIPWLAQNPGRGSRSLLAWRAAVRAGLALLARGRLQPSVSPAGHDCWEIGPLEDGDRALLEALAGALPAEAHAVPLAGEEARIWSPAAAVRACWDAVADALPRTAAAPLAFGGALYAEWRRQTAYHLVEQLTPAAPSGGADPVRLRLTLPTRAAPRLDLEGVQPPPYGARVTLHLGARRWPPLARVLSDHATEVAGSELDAFLDAEAELWALGIRVAVPAVETLDLRAVVGSPAVGAGPPRFSLDTLVDFDWELAAGSDRLTAEEVEELTRAPHRLVRLRGRWLRVEPGLAGLPGLADTSRRRLRAGEALAAALTGAIEVGGRSLPARAVGGLDELRRRLSELAGPREEPEPPGLEATLRGYQRRGLAWLEDVCELGLGGCLADDMGLGKTIQVIALHVARGLGPALVVCPTSVLGNWERELRAFAPAVPVRRYHGGNRGLHGLAGNEVVLTTYGVVRKDRVRLAGVAWDLLVADEAQHVKNPASAAARELRRLPARARLALTGTPVENRLLDLWAILDWTTPGLLGSSEAFQAWTAPIERGDDGRADDRLRRLVRPFLLRRRKTDPGVAPELPAKTETDHLVPLTREQVDLYEAVVRETMEGIRGTEGVRRRGLVLKLLTMLKQVCNHPAHYLRQEGPLEGRSGKLEWLDEQLEVILAGGESVLVFTQYVAMGRLLERHLAGRCPVAFLHGGLPVGGRERLVGRFQAGQVPVLLVSLRAGGFGLNLARATHVVHFDRWWNPAVEEQATDRAHRIGQDRAVQVHRLVTEGTVEERVAALLAHKRDLAERVAGGGEAWVSELSDQELADLVQLQTAS